MEREVCARVWQWGYDCCVLKKAINSTSVEELTAVEMAFISNSPPLVGRFSILKDHSFNLEARILNSDLQIIHKDWKEEEKVKGVREKEGLRGRRGKKRQRKVR